MTKYNSDKTIVKTHILHEYSLVSDFICRVEETYFLQKKLTEKANFPILWPRLAQD